MATTATKKSKKQKARLKVAGVTLTVTLPKAARKALKRVGITIG